MYLPSHWHMSFCLTITQRNLSPLYAGHKTTAGAITEHLSSAAMSRTQACSCHGPDTVYTSWTTTGPWPCATVGYLHTRPQRHQLKGPVHPADKVCGVWPAALLSLVCCRGRTHGETPGGKFSTPVWGTPASLCPFVAPPPCPAPAPSSLLLSLPACVAPRYHPPPPKPPSLGKQTQIQTVHSPCPSQTHLNTNTI